ncbi:hypothetical protein H6S82_01645 [Planktothrix sp. FACHB-1355]|uniref:Uncharacterized protein n=1 Tax=Aerosakkonema funiforme FACHB-1375 TaxID=2949571 RepID=A0A926ZK54_9CYAN|nr:MULTISPECIES: hypothetical protein [Oscillatoriales]MBD2185555.1 hypothetical protein [Aerosakkonema funiforme FACHB-1375]MBD3557572.1 hypothetical protein [Planktothrix sp. FACHB-1355]
MGHPTLLPTHKVPIENFNTLASQLRQAGAKFRSSIHKQDATIVFSQLPSQALSILESGANFQETCEADLSGSTLTQVSNIARETSEFASNMEFPERQEVSQHEAEQVLAETQLTEVDNTTESMEVTGEILMDELGKITIRESVEIVESSEPNSMDNLIETTVPEIVESVEDVPEFFESGESALELVESIEKTSMVIPNLATEQQLLKLSKTKLKKLANKYGIEGRTRLEHHELVAALVNKVSLDNL